MTDNCDEATFGLRVGAVAGAAGTPWALPLLGSLVRREILDGASGEKAEWMYDMLREIERGSRRPKAVAVPRIEIR